MTLTLKTPSLKVIGFLQSGHVTTVGIGAGPVISPISSSTTGMVLGSIVALDSIISAAGAVSVPRTSKIGGAEAKSITAGRSLSLNFDLLGALVRRPL
jgi:hypothetical protein